MLRLVFLMAAAALLAGCVSTSGWRSLRIDGSSDVALRESVSRLDEALPRTFHRQMLALALADITRTGAQDAGETDDGGERRAHKDKDYRAQLDGLTYEGVITLADRAGTPILVQYYSGGLARTSGLRGMGPPSQFPNPTARGFSDSGRGSCSGCTAW